VVEVAVGDQDRVDLQPEGIDGPEDPLVLLPRIDDQAMVGAVATHDIAVLRDRADGERADVHGGQTSRAWTFAFA
jgi:hypothetical protein